MRKEELERIEGKKKAPTLWQQDHISSQQLPIFSQSRCSSLHSHPGITHNSLPSTIPGPWTYHRISPCLSNSFVVPTSSTSPTFLLLSSLLFWPVSTIPEPFSVLVLFHSLLLPCVSMTFKNLEGRSTINSITSGNEGKQKQGRKELQGLLQKDHEAKHSDTQSNEHSGLKSSRKK